MPNGFFYLLMDSSALDRSVSNGIGVWLVFNITTIYRNSFIKLISVDPDQTPRSAASDLVLRCLPMSILWDAKKKWV